MDTCSKCGKEFEEYRTPEEKLLQAIYGGSLCPKCYENATLEPCTKCGRAVSDTIRFSGLPYCPECSPGGE